MCHPEVPAGEAAPAVRSEEIEIPLQHGPPLPAHLAMPEEDGAPGILVVSDIYGRSPFYENIAARLAQAGFQALLPEYFFRLGPLAERTRDAAIERRGRLDQRLTLNDLESAASWLRARPEANGRMGTVGFCMGGTLVLDLTPLVADVATVCYYGFPARPAEVGPFTPPAPLDVADRIRGPILAFWGDQDTAVGMQNVADFAQAMKRHGTAFEHMVYPGLGHGFLSASQFDPDNGAYHAACDSWTRTIGFLHQELIGG